MNVPPELHQSIAAALFNRSWELIDLAGARTAEQDDELLTVACASKFHWTRVDGVTAENLAIADNQIARAAAAVGLGDLAVRYASRALERTLAEGWTDWRLASAHEICARAFALAGDREARDSHLAKAREAASGIEDAEDRAVVENQIATVPGA
jgi:hypothetical protein